MKCPKCSFALEDQEICGLAGFTCANCEGLWLEHVVVIAHLKEQLKAQGLPNKTVGLLETPPTATDMSCPSCAEITLSMLKFRGIEVEQCGECRGTFFDRGELETIAQRLGFANKDARAIDARRAAKRSKPGSIQDLENTIGGAIEAAVWGFDVDI